MGKNFKLPTAKSLDDLFGSNDIENKGLKVVALENLDDFETGDFGHTFQVLENEDLKALMTSIEENGVLTPLIVRQKPSGRYEVIAGHRRKKACEMIGLSEVPVIEKNFTDDEAIIAMADTNLQRETLLPSEKAFSYRAKMEAMNRQGKRNDLSDGSSQNTAEIIGEQNGDSRATVFRYIQLTYLIPDLLCLVDEGKIKLGVAGELSKLKDDEQEIVLYSFDTYGYPSAQQMQYIVKMAKENRLTEESLKEYLSLDLNKTPTLKITEKDTKEWFPDDYVGDAEAKRNLIEKLVKEYFEKM